MKGFLDYGEVKIRSSYINSLTYRDKQLRLFPDIRFNCQGFLTMITFGAQTRNGINNTLLPELQIWRKLNSNNSYIKIHSIPFSKSKSSNVNNVHELQLNNPVEFNSQDFIGIYQPDVDNSQLVVFYQETSGPKNLVVAESIQQSPTAVSGLNNSRGNDYPLVTVRIG